jgi:hypothetical protein
MDAVVYTINLSKIKKLRNSCCFIITCCYCNCLRKKKKSINGDDIEEYIDNFNKLKEFKKNLIDDNDDIQYDEVKKIDDKSSFENDQIDDKSYFQNDDNDKMDFESDQINEKISFENDQIDEVEENNSQ